MVELKKAKGKVKNYNDEIRQVDREIMALIRKNNNKPQPVTKYNSALTYKEKITYLLKKGKELNVTEIVEGIMSKEKDLNKEKVYSTVQKNLLRMANELQIIKIGDYNSKYKLNTTEH